jgi:hypothetical protein
VSENTFSMFTSPTPADIEAAFGTTVAARMSAPLT